MREQIVVETKGEDDVVHYTLEFGYAQRDYDLRTKRAGYVEAATVNHWGYHVWHDLSIYYKQGRGYYVDMPLPNGKKKRVYFTPDW